MFRRRQKSRLTEVVESVLACLAEGDEEGALRVAQQYVRGPGADPEGEALLALAFTLYRLEGPPKERGGATQ